MNQKPSKVWRTIQCGRLYWIVLQLLLEDRELMHTLYSTQFYVQARLNQRLLSLYWKLHRLNLMSTKLKIHISFYALVSLFLLVDGRALECSILKILMNSFSNWLSNSYLKESKLLLILTCFSFQCWSNGIRKTFVMITYLI